MTAKTQKALPWVEGLLLLFCVVALFRAYGAGNMKDVMPVAEMFHRCWNGIFPSLAF